MGRRVPSRGRVAGLAVQHRAETRRAGVRDVEEPEGDPDGRRRGVDGVRARYRERRPAHRRDQPVARSAGAPQAGGQPLHQLDRRARRAHRQAAVASAARAQRFARLGCHARDADLQRDDQRRDAAAGGDRGQGRHAARARSRNASRPVRDADDDARERGDAGDHDAAARLSRRARRESVERARVQPRHEPSLRAGGGLVRDVLGVRAGPVHPGQAVHGRQDQISIRRRRPRGGSPPWTRRPAP